MISPHEFIDLLEEKDLVSPQLIASLRKQVATATMNVTAAMVARGLVEKGHLSRLLAQRLLSTADESRDDSPKAIRERLGLPRKTLAEEKAEEDALGLAPLEEEQEELAAQASEEADLLATEALDWGLTPLDDPISQEVDDQALGLEPLGPANPPAAPPAVPATLAPAPAAPAAAAPLVPPAQGVLRPVAPPPGGAYPPVPAAPAAPAAPAGPTTRGPAAAPPVGGTAAGAGLDDLFADVATAPAPPPRQSAWEKYWKGGPRRSVRANIWDSPLLLLGGGALLILLVGGAALLWSLVHRSANEILTQAEDDYRTGNYTQAIAKYDEFLKNYPDHEQAGTVKIHRGLAAIRRASERTSDWAGALEVAQRELPGVSGAEARAELKALLPEIASGLAEQARVKGDAELVKKAHTALELVDRYIPYSERPIDRLNAIAASLAATERQIVRTAKLDEAVFAIESSVAGNRTASAYGIRRALLKEYPSLADEPRLEQAIRAASAAEIKNVRWVDKTQAPAPAPSLPAADGLVLAPRNLTAAADAKGLALAVVAGGAAYGVDAASGKALWRRVVGVDINGRAPSFAPSPISNEPGADVLLVERNGQQVLRLEAASGNIRWAFAVGEPFDAHPVIDGQRLRVATRQGRLITIDLETGQSPGYIELPQELRTAPAVDTERSSLYQIAEHSNLYVLDSASGQPREVVYLAHEPGTIVLSPWIVGPYLVAAVGDRLEHTALRVFALDGDKNEGVRQVQEIGIEGHLDCQPSVSAGRFLLATSRGEIQVYEATAAKDRPPLALVASTKIEMPAADAGQQARDETVHFSLLTGSEAWVADTQLTRYEVLASRSRLEPRAVVHERSVTLEPLKGLPGALVHVRRRQGMPGVVVTAVSADGAKPLWEVRLAEPLAGEPMATDEGVLAVTAGGALFRFDRAQAKVGDVADSPFDSVPADALEAPLNSVVSLSDGALALTTAEAAASVFIYQPGRKPVPTFRLPLDQPAATRPVRLGAGALLPTIDGLVRLLSPASGAELAMPFQPPLTPADRSIAWGPPLALNDKQAVIAGDRRLYRLQLNSQPQPHLAAAAERELAEPLAGELAFRDERLYGVDSAGQLVAFSLPDLAPVGTRRLAARTLWGPRRVGDYILLETDDSSLHHLDDAGNPVPYPLPYGPLAGCPTVAGEHLILASTSGVVWRIDPLTGKELGKLETGLPLATGALAWGDQMLVAGRDGVLRFVDAP